MVGKARHGHRSRHPADHTSSTHRKQRKTVGSEERIQMLSAYPSDVAPPPTLYLLKVL